MGGWGWGLWWGWRLGWRADEEEDIKHCK